jgi:hypothetical protein
MRYDIANDRSKHVEIPLHSLFDRCQRRKIDNSNHVIYGCIGQIPEISAAAVLVGFPPDADSVA